ncbi:hypothetical protein HanIR_Chr15g0775241 [Helianthus annuus]|nr:hypothetical protein HanIR_Chr15g0775241 [Helianthus annuus]
MHVHTHLLNHITNVRSGECQILKCTCQTTILSWIIKLWTGRGTQFQIAINWRGNRVTRRHTGPFNNVSCILVLREEHSIGLSSDLNPKKMTKRAKIFHGEFIT